MNLTQASVWNVGTCLLDVKGATQAEILQESEYQCEAQGRMIPYDYMDVIDRQCRSTLSSSDEGAVMALEQRGSVIPLNLRINHFDSQGLFVGGIFGNSKTI